ncbi:hypothetical protein EXIGLDRAFT_748550 [Exidia glandulosa HHB12029]|uniref:Uncharacterized protein n=1 Tax=Exidia glandulosa HHB12029 TaxID=1314781 RepID=A0A166ARS5_EXIGL|nr:hypothetical protein EXIGLDRAFT_748550 [Exidia glandulosa HHB12029]
MYPSLTKSVRCSPPTARGGGAPPSVEDVLRRLNSASARPGRANPSPREHVVRAAVLNQPQADLDAQARKAKVLKQAAARQACMRHHPQRGGSETAFALCSPQQSPRATSRPCASAPPASTEVSAIVAQLIADMDASTAAARSAPHKPALKRPASATPLAFEPAHTQELADALTAIAALEREFVRVLDDPRSPAFKVRLEEIVSALDGIPCNGSSEVRRARRRLLLHVSEALRTTRRVSFQLPAQVPPPPPVAKSASPSPSAVAYILGVIRDMEHDFQEIMAHSTDIDAHSYKRLLKSLLRALRSIRSHGVPEVREARNNLYLNIVEAYMTTRRVARELQGPEAAAEAVKITKVVLVPVYEPCAQVEAAETQRTVARTSPVARVAHGDIARSSPQGMLVRMGAYTVAARPSRLSCARWAPPFAAPVNTSDDARIAAISCALRAVVSSRRASRRIRLRSSAPSPEEPRHVVPTLIITPPENDTPSSPVQEGLQQHVPLAGVDAPMDVDTAAEPLYEVLPSPVRAESPDSPPTPKSPLFPQIDVFTQAEDAPAHTLALAVCPTPLDIVAGAAQAEAGELAASSPTSSASSQSDSDWEDGDKSDEEMFEVV